MKKFPVLLIISLILVVLQQAMFSKLEILHIAFDVIFVYIICFSLTRNDVESVMIALITGIIRDSFFPGVFGINTVVYVLTSYLCSVIQKRIYKNTIIIPITLVFIFSIFKGIVGYIFLFLVSYKYDFLYSLENIILIEGIYNAVISIIVYKLVLRMNLTKLLKEDWKF